MTKPLKSLRGAIMVSCFLAFTFMLIPVQMVAVRISGPMKLRIPLFYHRGVCRLLGIRVREIGAQENRSPILVVANHTSWLDIPILSSVFACSFIAKSEVGGWPLFGTLARLQRTLFVEREKRGKTAVHRDKLLGRIASGDRLILFAEGTSSDGNRVLPFNSALLSVAQLEVQIGDEMRKATVQPVSVAYTHLHGLPMGRQYRPFFAWYGDMDLVPHLWEAFSLGPIDVTIQYHRPVTIDEFSSRKTLTAHCQTVISDAVAAAITGRLPEIDEELGSETVGAVQEPVVSPG
jgi:1-acyl-sn-glycerol-3-phosphate acyltransferase